MKKNILTKALCMILAFALCLTVISVPVMAEDTDISTQRNKIYGLTSQDKYKTDNNGYQTEAEAAGSPSEVVIGENLSVSQLPFCDRNNYKFSSISEDMLGASFIRVVRNHSIFANVDSSTPVKKTVEGQDPVTEDKFGGYSGNSSYGFRINKSLTHSPWYNGAFSAANGERGYYEFYVSSDCTVVVADNAGHGYPNLDKKLWTKSDGKTHQIYNGKTTYYREYKAGSLVQIPNYGIGGNLADNTKVTYEYTDKGGIAQTYETTVGANNYSVFEDIAIAIKWDEPISYDVTLKSVTAGGKAADLSAMENNTINVGVPVGSVNVAFEVVANSEYATVSGAPETVSIGDTVEIVVTAEGGNTETYYINVVEEAFDITVDATDEYKALFADGKYTGNYVFKKEKAPTVSSSTVSIAYPDKDGIWKNRTYEVKIDGEVYITGAKYSEAIAIRDAEENKDKTVTLTAKGYKYDESRITMMKGSAFNSDAHNFGPVGSALKNADFQIMTSRSTAPGRIANHRDAFVNPDAAVAWLKVDSNYLMKVKPNKKATIYVVMYQPGSKNHTQYIKDGWSLVDSSSYFVSDRVDSLPAEAIIDEMEHVKTGKAWYMVEPSYELTAAPYSFVKIQYDTGSDTLATPYPYAWYKTVEADEELLIPTVGVCADESAQQPPKVFVIEGEHKEWTPLSKDATLSEISYSVNGVVNGNIELTDKDEYTIDVAYGAEEVVIDAVATEENATVEITQADLAAGVNKATIKVTAPDSMYTKEYTVTVNIEAPKAKITVSTNGKGILATIGDAPQANLGDVNTATYESGTAIVLEAVANENQTFMYWKEANIDTTGGMIVSENPVYSFIAGSDKNLSAVFADDAVYTVAFRSNGKIIAYGTPEALDVVPVDPYWAGYVFSGWYVNGELTALKAGEKIGELTENTEYKAGFTKSEDVYSVEVLNGENADAQILYKQYNDKVELTALDVAEKEFVCWKRDGKVVSYSKAYSFYVSGNTKIIAEYSLEKPEAPAVVITLAEPVVVAGNKLAYYAERNVKAGLTVIEAGILLSKSADFDINSYDVKAVAKSTANIGQFTIRKANVTSDQSWYGKAYVIYKDANGNTDIAYSELIGPDTVEQLKL